MKKKYYFHISYIGNNGITNSYGDMLIATSNTTSNATLNNMRQFIIDTCAKDGVKFDKCTIIGMTLLPKDVYEMLKCNRE